MTGYWPPTNIQNPNYATEPLGMLQEWIGSGLIQNWNGTGYDVMAVATEFPGGPIGYNVDQEFVPFWGKGSGDLIVDYVQTSQEFWSLIAQYLPVAVMSFSRGDVGVNWQLEIGATNLANASWRTVLDYTTNDGSPSSMSWNPPIVGGSALDPALPDAGMSSQSLGPPDATLPAGSSRTMNLPVDAIQISLSIAFDPSVLNPVINNENMGISADDMFVSAFMGYNVAWYKDWAQENFNPNCTCGHTHVGTDVSVANAKQAVDYQVQILIDYLDSL